jgi:RNase P protein component
VKVISVWCIDRYESKNRRARDREWVREEEKGGVSKRVGIEVKKGEYKCAVYR